MTNVAAVVRIILGLCLGNGASRTVRDGLESATADLPLRATDRQFNLLAPCSDLLASRSSRGGEASETTFYEGPVQTKRQG